MYAVVIHNNFVELVEAKFLFCKQHKYPVRMVSTHVVINCRGEEKTFSPSHMLPGGGTPIHYLYRYVPPKGVVILKPLV